MSRKESTGICADSACNQCERIALRKFHWNFKFCFNEFRTDCVLFACINNSEKKLIKFSTYQENREKMLRGRRQALGAFVFLLLQNKILICAGIAVTQYIRYRRLQTNLILI